jgi:hypothetical protein
MTAGVRRWTRRRESNDLPIRLAAVRRYRSPHVGSVEAYLLGQDRFRKMVALALFLARCRFSKIKILLRSAFEMAL